MALPAYDIFKKDAAAAMIWVESVGDLESAKIRVRELLRDSNAEYAIFNQHTRKVVFKAGRQPIAGRDSLEPRWSSW